MRDKNFRIQVVCVLALIALASWPRFGPIKEQATVWRANPLEVKTQAAPLNGAGTDQNGSASTFTLPEPNRLNQSTSQSSLLDPASRAGNDRDLTRRRIENEDEGLEIVGRARTTMNEPVPYATLVLRNQVTGAVEGRARADESGRFEFRGLRTGRYVIELVDKNGRVASAAPAVPSGQTGSLGNRVQLAQATLFVASTDNLTTVFGATTTSTAPETVRAAGTQDVPRVNDLDAAVSPRR